MGISSGLGSSALLPAGLGFRNVIINGGFDVWQRGTTATIPNTRATSYLADRWSAYRDTAGSTQSRVAAGLDGFRYAMRVQRNSGNTDQSNGIFVTQSFETSEMVKLAGKRVALSFYARAGANWSATASRLRGTLQAGSGTEANMMYDGINNGIYAVNVPIYINVGLTTSWQLFTLTGLIPSGSNGGGVEFEWLPQGTPAGAADYFEITGVQLEANTQSTPFEQRPYGTELALCQRYYETSYISPHAAGTATTLGIHLGSGTAASRTTGEIRDSHQFMVEKRATPSVTLYSNTGQINTVTRADYGIAYNGNRTGSVTDPSRKSFGVYSGDSGAHGSALLFHFVAEAEL